MRILPRGEVAVRLKAARIKTGKTQSGLATELDLAQSTICAWEQATSVPEPARWNDIAEALEVSPAELFFEEEQVG